MLHANDDCRRLDAGSSSLATRIGGTPDLEPLRNLITSKRARGTPAAGSLAALGEGGWWTQERLFQEGRVPDPYCRACGERGGLGPTSGSIYHRCCACPSTAALRDAHKMQEVIGTAQSALHCSEPLFCHGVPLLLDKPAVPSHMLRCCGGRQPPIDFSFTGNAFTDGSLRGRVPSTCRRAGWACVLVDGNADVIATFYGPCPDYYPTVFRAELRAVIELLVMAMPLSTSLSTIRRWWMAGRRGRRGAARWAVLLPTSGGSSGGKLVTLAAMASALSSAKGMPLLQTTWLAAALPLLEKGTIMPIILLIGELIWRRSLFHPQGGGCSMPRPHSGTVGFSLCAVSGQRMLTLSPRPSSRQALLRR